jgi:oligosaccharide repeat unit polymerase
MELVIINAILYVSALGLHYVIFRRVMDAGFVLLALYAFVAVMGAFYYYTDPNEWKLSFWPFALVFFTALLSMWPFFRYRTDLISDRITVRKPGLLKCYCIIFIVCTLVSLFFSCPKIMEAIAAGAWRDVYNEHLIDGFHMWDNQMDRVAKWVTAFSETLAMLSFFYFLTDKNKANRLFALVLGLAIIANIFILAALTGTRGTIMVSLANMFFAFLLYQGRFPRALKWGVVIAAVGVLVSVQIFTAAVAESRFSGSTLADNHLMSYFGQPMLVFNYGIADSIKHYLYGGYMLGSYGGEVDAIAGTHCSMGFFTFIGCWYLDFGFFGVLALAVLLPLLFFYGWNRKDRFYFADMFLYLFWLRFLFQGVFILGKGWLFSIFFTLVLYGIAKVLKI